MILLDEFETSYPSDGRVSEGGPLTQIQVTPDSDDLPPSYSSVLQDTRRVIVSGDHDFLEENRRSLTRLRVPNRSLSRREDPGMERSSPSPSSSSSSLNSSDHDKTTVPSFSSTCEPTPGHPLLHKNRILVYPPHYKCMKCANTGYKRFDPNSRCKCCWRSFSKPYVGMISDASWNAKKPSGCGKCTLFKEYTLQRFLPDTKAKWDVGKHHWCRVRDEYFRDINDIKVAEVRDSYRTSSDRMWGSGAASPTTNPTPGRPLLSENRILVCPPLHTCGLCACSGYRRFDPNKLCGSCWRLFGRPFEGPITFAPWALGKSIMWEGNKLQLPLPKSESDWQVGYCQWQNVISNEVLSLQTRLVKEHWENAISVNPQSLAPSAPKQNSCGCLD